MRIAGKEETTSPSLAGLRGLPFLLIFLSIKSMAGVVCGRLIFFSRRKVSLLWLSQQVRKTTNALSESLHIIRHGIVYF